MKKSNSEYYYFVSVKHYTRIRPDISDIIREGITHNILSNIYRIELTIITELPVHVGTGRVYYTKSIPNCICVREHFKNEDGVPIIPASSMKGALSTYYLALFKDNYEVTKLFGGPGYQSRIFLSDFIPTERIEVKYKNFPPQWRPKIREPPKIKLYKPIPNIPQTNEKTCLEYIPKGVKLKGRITVINSNDTEVAKILIAMGYTPEPVEPPNYLMIGYGKGKGLGRIKVIDQPKILKYRFGLELKDGENPSDIIIEKMKTIIGELRENHERDIWKSVYRSTFYGGG